MVWTFPGAGVTGAPIYSSTSRRSGLWFKLCGYFGTKLAYFLVRNGDTVTVCKQHKSLPSSDTTASKEKFWNMIMHRLRTIIIITGYYVLSYVNVISTAGISLFTYNAQLLSAIIVSSKSYPEWETIQRKWLGKPEPMLFLTTDMAPTTFRPFGW